MEIAIKEKMSIYREMTTAMPQDIVNAVLYLLEGGDFVTGHTLIVDGGRLIRGSGM